MRFERLRSEVYRANLDVTRAGLVVLTWGNVSGVDRRAGVMAIKPSGVDYDRLRPEDIVVLSLQDGRTVDGRLRPSSDTPTHLALYRAFPQAGGVVHTHSTYATAWAQAGRDLPCLGTTHADHFRGAVPTPRALTAGEVRGDYEANTGLVIIECFRQRRLDPVAVPAALVRGHGPFAWGAGPAEAVGNAIALESVARMALAALQLNPRARPLPAHVLNKHYLRKHGPGATYGQAGRKPREKRK